MVTGETKRPLPPLWYEGYPGARQNKLCSLSRYLRFDELCRVLESYGYTMNASKSGSGHYTFRKPGCRPITIPKHESVLRIFAFQKRRGAWQISLRAWQHNGNKKSDGRNSLNRGNAKVFEPTGKRRKKRNGGLQKLDGGFGNRISDISRKR